jgi:hypothetical protein|tara:strand:+ start:144 stop:320 length:177 start_codon:yes stop_codon:yes gene_type:complete
MNGAKIASDIAKVLLAEKKMKLNARIDEVAAEKNMSVLEKAKLRARAIDAMDRGELVI